MWEIKWVHFRSSSSENDFKLFYDRSGPVIRVGEESTLPLFIDELMGMLQSGERQFEIKARDHTAKIPHLLAEKQELKKALLKILKLSHLMVDKSVKKSIIYVRLD